MRNLRLQLIAWSTLLLGLFLINTGYTSADLFAERRVSASFSAATLVMNVLKTANNKKADTLFTTYDMVPDGFEVGALRVKKGGKMGFQYRMSTRQLAGDTALCDKLQIEVWKKTESIYNGALKDLRIDSTLDTSKPDDWVYFVRLDDTNKALAHLTCTFDLRFKTYTSTSDVESTKGLYSATNIHNTVTTGTW